MSGCCLEGLESRNCLAELRDVCVTDGGVRLTFGGSLVRNARFADFDEVSTETLVLET